MAELRVHRAQATAPVSTGAQLRVHRLTAGGGAPASATLRAHRLTATGTAADPRRLRVHRVAATGSRGLRVVPIPAPAAAEPGTRITLTAELEDGTPDGTRWTWRRITGPAVTLEPDGPTCAIVVPSVMPNPADPTTPAQLRLGVTGSVNGSASAEAVVAISVLPQTRWVLTSAGWAGRRHRVL